MEGQEIYPELESRVRITTKGTYADTSRGDVDRNLVVIVKPAFGRSVLDYAVAAGDMLKLNAGAQIGDPFNKNNVVYVGANMISPSETLVGGGLTPLYGTAELMTSVVQSKLPVMDPGPVEYGVDELFFPTYDLAALKAKAQANTSNPAYPGGMYFTGGQTFKDETIEGVVYVEGGKLALQGNMTVNGTLVCVGMEGIQCTGNLVLRAQSVDFDNEAPNVAMVQVGGLKLAFSPNNTIDIEGYIFSDAIVQVDSGGTITGAIISSASVEIGAKAVVYFQKIDAIDIAREILVPGRWGLGIEAWVEEPDIKDVLPKAPPVSDPENPPPTV